MTDPPDFSVDVVAHPGARIVAPHGEIDIATVGEVASACAVDGGLLVLDLRGVEFLDTSGLHLVVECQRRAEADGLAFVVVRGPAHVQRLFDIAGIDHRVRFVDDAAEALGDGRPPA
jgi:anti-sigma B factor antagonist